MRVGVPTEIKVHEYRVGLVPAAVRELVAAGHEVAVQSGAGRGIGCSDDDYRAAGARIAADADAIFRDSQLIVKVKEPQAGRVRAAAPRSGAVHLSAPGRRSRAGRCAAANPSASRSPTRRSPPPMARCRC